MRYAYEEPGYIKICGHIQKAALNRYDFTCPCCGAELIVGTDGGRYGNIGSFACQKCGRAFHATDDDYVGSVLHIFAGGEKLMDLPQK